MDIPEAKTGPTLETELEVSTAAALVIM